MDNSKFLAKVIGLYLIIVCLGMVANMTQFVSLLDQLSSNLTLMFVVGFFTLIVGLLLVVSHNIWQLNWRVIITIIAWLTLIKGISIIFYPQFIDRVSLLFIHDTNVGYSIAAWDLLLGLVLCYFGFRSNK